MRVRLLFFYLAIFVLVGCESKISSDEGVIDREESLELAVMADLYHINEFDSCIKVGELFVENYPNNDMGWQLLSSAFLGKGEDSLSKYCVLKTLELNPKNHIGLLNYGILLDKIGKHVEASEFYEESLEINDSLYQTYSNYAGNRLLVGDYRAAVALGEKAVEIGDNIKDKGILCLSYHKIGDMKNRDVLFDELKKMNYENLESLREVIYD
jgi:tetratricopeptide (TPR) repeat protein